MLKPGRVGRSSQVGLLTDAGALRARYCDARCIAQKPRHHAEPSASRLSTLLNPVGSNALMECVDAQWGKIYISKTRFTRASWLQGGRRNSPGKGLFFVNSRYAYSYTVANGELQPFQHPMVDNPTQLYISGFLVNVVVKSQSATVEPSRFFAIYNIFTHIEI